MYPRKRVGLERALLQLMHPKNFYIPKKLIHIAIILHPKENEHKNTILQRCVHKFTMSSGRADDLGTGQGPSRLATAAAGLLGLATTTRDARHDHGVGSDKPESGRYYDYAYFA